MLFRTVLTTWPLSKMMCNMQWETVCMSWGIVSEHPRARPCVHPIDWWPRSTQTSWTFLGWSSYGRIPSKLNVLHGTKFFSFCVVPFQKSTVLACNFYHKFYKFSFICNFTEWSGLLLHTGTAWAIYIIWPYIFFCHYVMYMKVAKKHNCYLNYLITIYMYVYR